MDYMGTLLKNEVFEKIRHTRFVGYIFFTVLKFLLTLTRES